MAELKGKIEKLQVQLAGFIFDSKSDALVPLVNLHGQKKKENECGGQRRNYRRPKEALGKVWRKEEKLSFYILMGT